MSTGGDQGRDFETYETQLPGQVQRIGRDLGVPDPAMVGFACTLQKSSISTKIRSDVDKIMSEGTAVDFVVYYCEVDIPVARRHSLEKEIRSKHGVRLAIFDGNAISELLADHANFWIAETYLHVPSRVLPPPPGRPDWYEEDLLRWKGDTAPVETIGQVVDITGCLHYACADDGGKQDIPFWLHKLEPLLIASTPLPLRRRARYQFISAHIRGLESLRPVDHLVAELLDEVSLENDPKELSDAAVILNFAIGAKGQGVTSLTVDRISSWSDDLVRRVRQQLERESSPGQVCTLLETLALLLLQPDIVAIEAAGKDLDFSADIPSPPTFNESLAAFRSGSTVFDARLPLTDADEAVRVLGLLVAQMADAPLFPTETVSGLLSVFAPWLVDIDGYDALTSALDDRVAESSGDSEAADRALDRAIALFNAERTLEGLRHLHRVRIGLFNGATRTRMISATLATASAYEKLHMYSAAKYFGLVSARLSGQDHLEQHSQGLVRAAFADYHQGNWVSAVHLNCSALISHSLLVEQPYNFERHTWLPGTFFELTNIQALSAKLGEPYAGYVDTKISDAGAKSVLNDLQTGALAGTTPWWDTIDTATHIEKITGSLGRPPFADAAHRRIRFACLGVTWSVVFANTYRDNPIGERFAAALQVVLLYIAQDHDPAFLPTRITSFVEIGNDVVVRPLPSDPGETRLRIALPEIADLNVEAFSYIARATLTSVSQVVLTASTIADEAFKKILHAALEDDLLSLIVFGVPYDIAWRDSISEECFDATPHTMDPLVVHDLSVPPAHPRLNMPISKGPGYDSRRSLEEIADRYQDLPPRIAPTLELLKRDKPFATVVSELRSEGWLDWHLVITVHNVARNARLRPQQPRSQAEMDALVAKFMEPEPDGDPVPTEAFTSDSLRLAYAMAASTTATNWWNLTLRQKPLDTEALLHLLATRYGWAEDDVDHTDLFRSISKR